MGQSLKRARQKLKTASALAWDAYNHVEERGGAFSGPVRQAVLQLDKALERVEQAIALNRIAGRKLT